MKQILSLFLALLPCLAWAQYPSNGNQKITLGEQTTADGLIWRGVAADTTLTAKSDTAAYFVLDTVNKKLYFFKASATPKWNEISGSGGGGSGTVTSITGGTGLTGGTITTSGTLAADTNFLVTRYDTSAMLTPYWRAGNFSGTLPVANGGTGSATQNFVDLTTAQSIGGIKTLSNELILNNSLARQININSNNQYGGYILFQKNSSNIGFLGNAAQLLTGSTTEFEFRAQTTLNLTAPTDIKLYSRDVLALTLGASQAATFSGSVTATDLRLTNLTNVTDLRTDADGDLFNGASDVNLKNNIEPITYGLNEVLKIKPVQFYWNKDKYNYSGYKTIGFIAQDLMDIIPNAATVSGDGCMQIEYTAIIATLTKAIQEQNSLIKALEQRIINLENK